MPTGFHNALDLDALCIMVNPMNKHNQSTEYIQNVRMTFSHDMLEWYDNHARRLPWRVPPGDSRDGVKPDPYAVWLSEIMLQQTQVATVQNYYLNFLRKWPDVFALAEADSNDVMKAWAGLGYYSRARNLKSCAEQVVAKHGGRFPETAEELKRLPGIGDYTSAAIAAIAFDEPVAVVDGNIERIIARCFAVATPLPSAKKDIRNKVADLVPSERPGDFAQAMMDLGATICTPRNPGCSLCPVSACCLGFTQGEMERYPIKAPKAQKPTRKGAAFVIINAQGAVWLSKRADKGLLGGMSEVPGTEWTSRVDGETGNSALPFTADWRLVATIRHTFTHFHLELEIWTTRSEHSIGKGWWSGPGEIDDEALPTIMRKAIAAAMPGAFRNEPDAD